MEHLGYIKRFQWRASPPAGSKDAVQPHHKTKIDQVMILVGGANQALLVRHLQKSYSIIYPQEPNFIPGSFDIAIVDLEGLTKWQKQLFDQKIREEPTFLPIVLVLTARELQHRHKKYWDIIDEFIIIPTQPHELTERIGLLLRTRHLALAQRENLAYLVNHDRITRLPNKNLFLERLSDVIHDATVLNKKLYVGVLHISMSQIMHSLGLSGMEAAAYQCSIRLKGLFKNEFYIASLATEEWGLIARPGEDITSAIDLFRRIKLMAEEPVEVNGENIHLSPRIGIGIYPEDGSDATSILTSATTALSSAKSTDPVFYSPQVQHEALRFLRTQTRLYEALEKQQFELWYQPQISLATGQIVGVEALVRWRLPSGQLVPPNEFVSVAEFTGQIVAIDRWVFHKACSDMKIWQQNKLGINRISVNIAVADIEEADFVPMVQNELALHGLPSSCLELELTETALLDANQSNLEKLHLLREIGIRIAMDDFGTGYSSLAYLHKLPITTLKIDKSFIDNVIHSDTDASITETIVLLANKFKLETVAEGVEAQEQADFLKSINVTLGQGYFYAKPMPAEELYKWLVL